MTAKTFREKLKSYLHTAGKTQKQLAHEMALHPSVLSHKINQTDDMVLSAAEVKGIVRLLVGWQAINRRSDALELLRLMDLNPAVFTDAEWTSAPLNLLDDEPAPAAMPAAPPVLAASLPTPVNPLIGRESLIESVETLLYRSDARLVTLTGTGGVGKTRLALEVGRHAPATLFSDGAAFITLTRLTDPQLVAFEIAYQLKLKPDSYLTAADSLKEALAPQKRLIVLDNFEHLLPAAPLVAELLGAAPDLKILVTSRASLNLPGEHPLAVPPLDLPDVQARGSMAHLIDQPAIRLLVARSRAVRPDFELTEANARSLAEICIRLDGLPLALELAAARLRLFSPQSLLERLDKPLSMLTSASRDAALHQRTLVDTIAWSYNLLNADEQRLFRAVSLFPGGCTLTAVEALMDGENVQNCVTSLLDKSLIQRQEGLDQEIRLTMLQTLRAYALDQGAAEGSLEPMRGRQAAHYLALVNTAAAQLSGKNQSASLNLLEAEIDNLRTVLTWTVAQGSRAGIGLIGSLCQFWSMRGYASEGLRWLAQAYSKSWNDGDDQTFMVDYAKALNGGGVLAFITGDYAQAATYFEAALPLRRQVGDLEGLASTYNNLGNLAWNQSRLEDAKGYFVEAEQIASQIGNKQMRGSALNNLGALLQTLGDLENAEYYVRQALAIWQELENKQSTANALSNLGRIATAWGRFDDAATCYAESMSLMRQLGNTRNIAAVLSNMGDLALYRGTYEEAQRLLEETLTLQREVDYLWGVGSALCDLGRTAFYRGDYGTALAQLNEALTILRGLGDQEKIAQALEALGLTTLQMRDQNGAVSILSEALEMRGTHDNAFGSASSIAAIALVCARRGDLAQAVRLWGAAFTQWESLGRAVVPALLSLYQDELDSARARLGADSFQRAWDEGSAMDAETAVRAAL